MKKLLFLFAALAVFAACQKDLDTDPVIGGLLQGQEAIDLSEKGTANCYIVSTSGSYKFKAVVGNSEKLIEDIASTEVLWETFGTDVKPNVGDLISEVTYADSCISFRTGATYKEGNALIAAKNANGTILWSWHIWFTDQPKDQVYNNSAGTLMDRNLGATSATKGDVGALGLLYQWGRKDPFLSGGSTTSTTPAASTLESWPEPIVSDDTRGNIYYALENPTTFITLNTNNYDWCYSSIDATDDSRWEQNKTVFDPCPVGYRVPDGGIDGDWRIAFGPGWDYPKWDATNYGFDFGGTEEGTQYLTSEECWYPAAGRWDGETGELIEVGTDGYNWSCSPNYIGAGYMDFHSSNVIFPDNNSIRGHAYSVRCVK